MPETPVFSTAAVAAPHTLAAETGQTILAAGGNAVEAMAAMAATIAVVYPHMNGLGGDGFWLVRDEPVYSTTVAPNMARTCWNPIAIVWPQGSRSSALTIPDRVSFQDRITVLPL